MTGAPSVKVLCGKCGRLICRVIVTPQGSAYWIPAGHGGWASSPGGVFCPDHGWPDLAALDPAARKTHRAKMLPRPPVQE